ncbi:MAG: hypothetical protein MUC96_13370 [Myxococcaceae bacterium]|nr:hypothetical protein [Myxococcaceae bacterium]
MSPHITAVLSPAVTTMWRGCQLPAERFPAGPRDRLPRAHPHGELSWRIEAVLSPSVPTL